MLACERTMLSATTTVASSFAFALFASQPTAHAEAINEKETPDPAWLSAGAGIGFPRFVHLHVSAWLTSSVSLDLRGWLNLAFGWGDTTTAADGAFSFYFFEGRDRLQVQGGVAHFFDNDVVSTVPFAAAGWQRRSHCSDFTLNAGIMAGPRRDGDGVVWIPSINLTWGLRIPPGHCRSRR